MTDQTPQRDRRRTTVVIVAILVLVIVVVAVVGLLAANGAPRTAASSVAPTASSAASVPASTSSPTTSSKPTSSPSTTRRTAPATASAPQPTRTTSIASPAPIAKELTAKVIRSEAVQGEAQGPGEIAGPAVRFTIAITNSTGRSVDLSNTVVNVYYGKQSTPAVELQEPGGRPFPRSVSNGATARGVYVFTIPKDQRSSVVVTVDTSVKNPVVAFRGAAPR